MANRLLVEAKKMIRIKASKHKKLMLLKFETEVDIEEWADVFIEYCLNPEVLAGIKKMVLDGKRNNH